MRVMRADKRGFTLLELVAVMAVLAILAAILIPTLKGYIDEANGRACEINRMTLLQNYQVYQKLTPYQTVTFEEYMADEGSRLGLTCPDHGTYTYNLETGLIDCSVHGDSVMIAVTGTQEEIDETAYNIYYAYIAYLPIFQSQYSFPDSKVRLLNDIRNYGNLDLVGTSPNYAEGTDNWLRGKFWEGFLASAGSDLTAQEIKDGLSDMKVFFVYDESGHATTQIAAVYYKTQNPNYTVTYFPPTATEDGFYIRNVHYKNLEGDNPATVDREIAKTYLS